MQTIPETKSMHQTPDDHFRLRIPPPDPTHQCSTLVGSKDVSQSSLPWIPIVFCPETTVFFGGAKNDNPLLKTSEPFP